MGRRGALESSPDRASDRLLRGDHLAMDVALGLLLVQGALGAFDTLWYHEWRQRLPARPTGRTELRLHAARDFAYAVVFGSLGWAEWRGWFVWLLATILLLEIVITLWDFIEEDLRRP